MKNIISTAVEIPLCKRLRRGQHKPVGQPLLVFFDACSSFVPQKCELSTSIGVYAYMPSLTVHFKCHRQFRLGYLSVFGSNRG